jgi:hypothetical protein
MLSLPSSVDLPSAVKEMCSVSLLFQARKVVCLITVFPTGHCEYAPSRFPKIAVNTVIILCNYRPNHCSTPVGKVFVQRPVSPPQVQTNQSGQERQSPAPRPRKFLALATLQFTVYTYRRAGKVRGSQGIIARIPVSVLRGTHPAQQTK